MPLRIWVFVFVIGALAATRGFSAEPAALVFIDEMIGGVRATATPCATTVVNATRSHDMHAVCAEFDGSFELFRQRWGAHLGSTPGLGAEAQTGWRPSGGRYERIYALGSTVVGVRFSRGELLLVYK